MGNADSPEGAARASGDSRPTGEMYTFEGFPAAAVGIILFCSDPSIQGLFVVTVESSTARMSVALQFVWV